MEKTLKIRDLKLISCLLQRGIKYVYYEVEDGDNHPFVNFEFDNTEEFQSILTQYYAYTLLVEPINFSENYKNLKIFSYHILQGEKNKEVSPTPSPIQEDF